METTTKIANPDQGKGSRGKGGGTVNLNFYSHTALQNLLNNHVVTTRQRLQRFSILLDPGKGSPKSGPGSGTPGEREKN